jgi:hypothetical protein
MSNHPMNYLPFDYTRFTSELLPALCQAREGDTKPLENLIRSADHISLWDGLELPPGFRWYSVMHEPVPLSAERIKRFLFFSPQNFTGQLAAEKEGFDPWELLLKEVPGLAGKDFADYDEAACSLCCCLFFTFCCDVPSYRRERPAIFGHEEQTFRWQDYITENEEIAPLWDLFHQPPPLELATPFITSHPTDFYLGPMCPRQLEIFNFHIITITGFIMPEEASACGMSRRERRVASATVTIMWC